MHPRVPALLVVLALAPFALAAPARITFERTLPAEHSLGKAEDVVITQAIGDNPKIDSFVDRFIHYVNRGGVLRMRDMRGARPDKGDAQLAIKAFTCETKDAEGEGGTYDIDGKRVRRKHAWVDARCVARIDVLVGDTKSSFYVKGEGTSPRAEAITDEERNIALEQAARYAAVDASERIAPRRVRESILLDDTAPAYDEALTLIELERFDEARAVWVRALRQTPGSAALHYNLGAVCEALGDRQAAEQHYTAARQLAPSERRYASELRMFQRRNAKP